MIESYYWKDDLIKYAHDITSIEQVEEWTEEIHQKVEKNIIMGFFIIRKLIENHKFTFSLLDIKWHIDTFPPSTEIDNHNYIHFERIYDYDNFVCRRLGIKYICNIFIHSKVMYTLMKDENGKYENVYVTSNYDKNKRIYVFKIYMIYNIFTLFGNNYPCCYSLHYDEKKGDYIVYTE